MKKHFALVREAQRLAKVYNAERCAVCTKRRELPVRVKHLNKTVGLCHECAAKVAALVGGPERLHDGEVE
jgi:K+-sensing histidine kinase KdpD